MFEFLVAEILKRDLVVFLLQISQDSILQNLSPPFFIPKYYFSHIPWCISIRIGTEVRYQGVTMDTPSSSSSTIHFPTFVFPSNDLFIRSVILISTHFTLPPEDRERLTNKSKSQAADSLLPSSSYSFPSHR